MEEIAPNLWWWTAAHPDWSPEDLEDGKGWEQAVSSYALSTEDRLVLIDPLVDDWEQLDQLVERHGSPAVLITIMWHVRSSPQILDRYDGASVWAHEPAAEWVGERTRLTNTFTVGDRLPGDVEAIHMRRIEEVAYWLPLHNAVVLGDTLLGHDGRAELCPPTWVRQSETIEPAREAVRELMGRKPDRLLLTHGGPTEPSALEV
ncbi:MAG: MBL fold metallo-hydrolase [Actinomycetota bacterium]|nr:MBL fold metallo-hydrolase [Actinomycetota bacterium]